MPAQGVYRMINLHRRIVIEKKAHELTRPFSKRPIPIHTILEESGIEFFPFETEKRDVNNITAYYNMKGGLEIGVNLARREPIQAMATARMLGHHILHGDLAPVKKKGGVVLSKDACSIDDENLLEEAEFFARHVLVPTSLYTKVKGASRSDIAEVFGVTQTVIEQRKQDTNLFYKLRFGLSL